MHATGFDLQGCRQTNKRSVGGTAYGKLVNPLLSESYKMISLIVFLRKPLRLAYIFDLLWELEWGRGEDQLLSARHTPSYTETTSPRQSSGRMRMPVKRDLTDYHIRPSLFLLRSSTRRNQDSLKSELDRHELLPLLLIKRGFRTCHSRNERQNQDCLCPHPWSRAEGGERAGNLGGDRRKSDKQSHWRSAVHQSNHTLGTPQ